MDALFIQKQGEGKQCLFCRGDPEVQKSSYQTFKCYHNKSSISIDTYICNRKVIIYNIDN